MKSLSAILFNLFLICSISAFSQTTGNISGKITLVNGEPYASASATLVETLKTTLTDIKGNYYFYNLAPGTYHVKIQVLGAAQQVLEVNVIAGQTAMADYQFAKENVQALQEVTIASNTNKFAKKKASILPGYP